MFSIQRCRHVGISYLLRLTVRKFDFATPGPLRNPGSDEKRNRLIPLSKSGMPRESQFQNWCNIPTLFPEICYGENVFHQFCVSFWFRFWGIGKITDNIAPLIKERPNSKYVCEEKGSKKVLGKRVHFLCPPILNYGNVIVSVRYAVNEKLKRAFF
jgi:hypothetical protein